MGSWNEDDVKSDSWSDECLGERCDELLPDSNSVGISVSGVLDLPTFLETSLSRSESAWTFCCEVSNLVWGLLGARFIAFIQNRRKFPPHWTTRGSY